MIQGRLEGYTVVQKAPDGQRYVTPDGECLSAPADWVSVPASDPACERLLAAGPAICVTYTAGQSRFTTAVLVPPERVQPRTDKVAHESLRTRLIDLFDFAPRHARVAGELASAIAGHMGQGPQVDGGRSLEAGDLETAMFRWLEQHVESEDLPRRASRRTKDCMRARAMAIVDEYRAGLPRHPGHCPLVHALAVDAERN